jgi:hypothetical protein
MNHYAEVAVGRGAVSDVRFFKVWWPYAIPFAFIFFHAGGIFIHLYTFIHNYSPSPISIFLHCFRLSGRNLHGVPSRDSNPASKPAHYTF